MIADKQRKQKPTRTLYCLGTVDRLSTAKHIFLESYLRKVALPHEMNKGEEHHIPPLAYKSNDMSSFYNVC
jgi:hypothetical protein